MFHDLKVKLVIYFAKKKILFWEYGSYNFERKNLKFSKTNLSPKMWNYFILISILTPLFLSRFPSISNLIPCIYTSIRKSLPWLPAFFTFPHWFPAFPLLFMAWPTWLSAFLPPFFPSPHSVDRFPIPTFIDGRRIWYFNEFGNIFN